MADLAKVRAEAIKKIHTGKNRLALTDDSYRDMLERLTGQRSAKDLDQAQLDAVVGHLAGLGAFRRQSVGRSYAGKQARMVRAIWIRLAKAGIVKNRSDAALDAFVQKQCGIASCRFLRRSADVDKVVHALRAMEARAIAAAEGAAD